MPPPICPNCGAVVPATARACPECGADEETGWGEGAYAPNPDLPDEEFDYHNFVEQEFGEKAPGRKRSPVLKGARWFWWLVGLALILALLLVWR